MAQASSERPPRAVSRALREYQKWVRRWTFELTYCVSCDRPHLQQDNTGAGRFIHGVVGPLWTHSNTGHDSHTCPRPSHSLCADYHTPLSFSHYKHKCFLWLYLVHGLLANSISFLYNSTTLIMTVRNCKPTNLPFRQWSMHYTSGYKHGKCINFVKQKAKFTTRRRLQQKSRNVTYHKTTATTLKTLLLRP